MFDDEDYDTIQQLFTDIRYVGNEEYDSEPEFRGIGRFLPSEIFYGERD